MVSITLVALLEKELVKRVEELGGDVTCTDQKWDTVDGGYRIVYREVEVYFPDDEYDHETEHALDNLVDETSWSWDPTWDHENNGVLFDWYYE